MRITSASHAHDENKERTRSQETPPPRCARQSGSHQKINVRNRTDFQAYFGDATAYAGQVAIRRKRRKKNDEVPDYFVFVVWAYRVLRHWSLCQRQR